MLPLLSMRPRRSLIAVVVAAALVVAIDAQPPSRGDTWPAWRGPLGTGEASARTRPSSGANRRTSGGRARFRATGRRRRSSGATRSTCRRRRPSATESRRARSTSPSPKTRAVYEGIAPTSARRRSTSLRSSRSIAPSGRVRWRQGPSREQPSEGRHPTNTFASASPTTDGRRIIAFFGSRGLYALDMRESCCGSATSATCRRETAGARAVRRRCFEDRVVVTWDHEAESFIAALDAATRPRALAAPRNEPTTWATPLVVQGRRARPRHHQRSAARPRLRPRTGDEIWHGPGLTFNSIPSPVHADGIAYLTSGFQGNVLLAVDLAKASGNIEKSGALLWRRDRDTPYVVVAAAVRRLALCLQAPAGAADRARREDRRGKYGPVRIPELPDLYASPVAADGRIYAAGRDGQTVVFKHGPAFEVLSVNSWTTASTPRLPSSATRSTCAGVNPCIASPVDGRQRCSLRTDAERSELRSPPCSRAAGRTAAGARRRLLRPDECAHEAAVDLRQHALVGEARPLSRNCCASAAR